MEKKIPSKMVPNFSYRFTLVIFPTMGKKINNFPWISINNINSSRIYTCLCIQKKKCVMTFTWSSGSTNRKASYQSRAAISLVDSISIQNLCVWRKLFVMNNLKFSSLKTSEKKKTSLYCASFSPLMRDENQIGSR